MDPALDFDSILQLHELAEMQMDHGSTLWEPHIPDPVLRVQGFELRKPSALAHVWLSECAGRWWRNDEGMLSIASFWVMWRGRSRPLLFAMNFRPYAERELARTARRLKGSLENMMQAIRWFYSPGPTASLLAVQDTPGGGRMDPDPAPPLRRVAGLLQELYGQTWEYWLTEIPRETATSLIRDYVMRHLPANRSGEAADENDPRVEAFRQYREAEIAFVAKLRERAKAAKP